MAVPTPKRQNIQPVDTDISGTALTTALNDRIRRINEALATPTPAAATVVTTSTGTQIWQEIPTGAKSGSNRVFTLTHAPHPAKSLSLYLNGVFQLQVGGVDYTLSGVTITYLKPPVGDDWHVADYTY